MVYLKWKFRGGVPPRFLSYFNEKMKNRVFHIYRVQKHEYFLKN